MRSRSWPLVTAVACLLACGDDREAGDSTVVDPSAPARAACDTLDLGNVADNALCRRVQGQGLAPRYASTEAICRRMAIDIAGRTPTWSEVQTVCLGKTPGEIADYYRADPGYLRLARTRWADQFEYIAFIPWFRYVETMDELVGQAYEGEIDYPTFAVKALAHPAFTGRFFGEMRTARAFQIFLGRDAHPVERADLTGLWQMWLPIYDVDPEYGFEIYRVVVAPGFCAPPLDELSCRSELYGTVEVTLETPAGDRYPPETLIELEDLTPAQLLRLETPGRLITSLPSFHEQAVAEAMDRLLGWEAAKHLPEVLQALTRYFAGDAAGSLPLLEREILTSSLYLARHHPPSDEVDPADPDMAAPRWRYKPIQQVRTEVWMDAIQQAAQTGVGWCDHRYPFILGGDYDDSGRYIYHPHDFPVSDDSVNQPDYTYRDIAQSLGGCPDRFNTLRYTGTGAVHALMQEQFEQLVCYRPAATGLLPGGAFGGGFAPSDDADTLEALYRHQVRALLSRDPDDAEVAAFVDDTAGCGASGACEVSEIPGQLCEALIKSAEFLYY